MNGPRGTSALSGSQSHWRTMPTMLRSLFRFLAMALIALAVPVQGMASVVAGQCMAFGHHEDGGDDGSHAQAGADGHDHAAHSHADETAATHSDDGGSNSHCGPCTACCASASIAGVSALPLLPSPSNAKYVLSQWPPHGVQPHSLDRPPLAL